MPFSVRFTIACERGLSLPGGPVAIWGVQPDTDLSALPDALVISDDARVHNRFPNAKRVLDGPIAAAIVLVMREKKRSHAMLAEAAAHAPSMLIIDGQKTNGIEPVIKALKTSAPMSVAISKAHGKLSWTDTCPDLSDWTAKPGQVDGFRTMPGVFSADKVDAGSRLLAAALPKNLGPAIADLGAGWGWLSAQAVGDGRVLHLVETDALALDCARVNVPGATCHWADVTQWQTPQLMDSVIMNPPFHEGRKGVPALGAAFIAKAAEILKPTGTLYMVANRHLPYEETLGQMFGSVKDLPGDGRFKLFQATRPKRPTR